MSSDETITLEGGGPEAPTSPEAAELARLRAEVAALRATVPAESTATVRLAGQDHVLVRNLPLDERWNVYVNMRQPGREYVSIWAALALCMPAYRQRDPYLGDLISYGRRAFNTLMAEGASFAEIELAGLTAVNLITRGLVNVESAADFSETPSAGRASAGSSPASGS
jgi:hypothetical protein